MTVSLDAMRSTQTMRDAWADDACVWADMTRFTLWNGSRITINKRCVDAVKALDMVLKKWGYEPRAEDTGAYNCRRITGGTRYSLHAYGIAIDINWSTNPYGRRFVTDMSMAMVQAIEAIRTNVGSRVWRWGGDWDDNPSTPHTYYDAMHYEIQSFPSELATGIKWSTVNGEEPGKIPGGPVTPAPKEPPYVSHTVELPTLRLGMKGEGVRKLQDRLHDDLSQPITVDGAFGAQTERAVKNVQRFFGLNPDGVVGHRTWGVILLASLPVRV